MFLPLVAAAQTPANAADSVGASAITAKSVGVVAPENSDPDLNGALLATVPPEKMIRKNPATGKSWPRVDDIIQTLRNAPANLDTGAGNKTTGHEYAKILFERFVIRNMDDLQNFFPAMYELENGKKTITFYIPEIDQKSDLYKSRKSSRANEYDFIMQTVDRINARVAATYSHEFQHDDNAEISVLGRTIFGLMRFNLEDELTAIKRNLMIRRDAFLSSGDVMDAMSGTTITEVPCPALALTAGRDNMTKDDMKAVNLQPRNLANYWWKNRKTILAEKTISPEEANVIIQTILDMFEKALMDDYIKDICDITQTLAVACNKIYEYLAQNPSEVAEFLKSHQNNPYIKTGNIVSDEEDIRLKWECETEFGKINLYDLLTEKDRANTEKRIQKLLNHKMLAALAKDLAAKFPGFDEMAKSFLNTVENSRKTLQLTPADSASTVAPSVNPAVQAGIDRFNQNNK